MGTINPAMTLGLFAGLVIFSERSGPAKAVTAYRN